MRVAAVAAAAAILLSTTTVAEQVFRDPENRFRFAYPDDWVVEEPGNRAVRAQISAADGTGTGCTFVRIEAIGLRGLSQAEIDERMDALFEEAYWRASLSRRLSDLEIHAFGKTTIDDVPAHFVVGSGFPVTMPRAVRMTMRLIVVARPGHVYSLRCATQEGLFDERRAVLERILESFAFEERIGSE